MTRPLLLAVTLALVGCAGPPNASSLPSRVSAAFFPIDTRARWVFEIGDSPAVRGSRFAFRSQAALPDGSRPVLTTSAEAGAPRPKMRLVKDDRTVRIVVEGDEIVLLRFGARVGDTWPYHAQRPDGLAHLTGLRYERVLGRWTTVAEVQFHARGLDSPVMRTYWFAPDMGWVRISSRDGTGPMRDAMLVGYEADAP